MQDQQLLCNTSPITEWTETIRVETNPHLGPGDPKPDIARITHNPVKDLHFGAGYERLRPAPGGYCVALISRKDSLIDGSNPNKSLITATKSSGTLARDYLGNMIVVCERSDDYRDLIDHLVTKWGPTALPEVGEIAAEEKAAEAAASRGFPLGIVLKGFMQFEILDFLPEDRRQLGPGFLFPLSQLIGMPIRLWKLLMPGFRDTNVEAAYLNINLDPARPSFGWARRTGRRMWGRLLRRERMGSHQAGYFDVVPLCDGLHAAGC
ncbi:hypothetical protein BJX66DRAFT_342957 [Aspergillus keveii]|uniref:Uncharacterized protein n=1 Tax=Aspergillus keveii TaxID=714993 RepID=A0ABR4FQQ3_9EURO